ncbi:MAG: hypothetical protein ABI668_07445 [Sphingorhabdus sp.]
MRTEFINYSMYSDISEVTGFNQPSTAAAQSSLIESLLEYRFLAELGAYLARFNTAMEVLRGDVDRAGHDIVLEAKGIMRHVQLKATIAGGKRSSITVNNALSFKPAGCIVWMTYDPVTYQIIAMRWFGGAPGAPLPATGDRVARHTKANSAGIKAAREQHRIMPGGKFEKMTGFAQLSERLFGVADPDRLLVEILGDALPKIMSEAPLALGSFAGSAKFAHHIDGYKLLQLLGHADHKTWLSARRQSAEITGSWTGTAAELWAALFLEHRHQRFVDIDSKPKQNDMLDKLAQQLAGALSRYG